MGRYTDFLTDMTYDIFEAEDYLEELKKIAELFRTFDRALDTVLLHHGYEGSLTDADQKVMFITERFRKAGIPIPRNIKKWYSEHKRIERKTAFELCFAFRFSIEEAEDFLRRICLMRGFDLHSMEEVVYFCALKHGWSYLESQNIVKQITPKKAEKVPNDNLIYTSLIAEEIDELETVEELISFLNENADSFAYNNAAAYETIRTIWHSISKKDGIALREKRQLYLAFDQEKDENAENVEGLLTEADRQGRIPEERKRKERIRKEDSIWELYLQILGLSGSYVSEIYQNRSLKPFLKDNALLHPLAEDSFPDRDGLTKILNGQHVSYERVRKILILLVFYKFWARKALEHHHYKAAYGDTDRCLAAINAHLMDAGYPMLYPGNPYDFIIFVSMNTDYPLLTFREYMRELFLSKLDNGEERVDE